MKAARILLLCVGASKGCTQGIYLKGQILNTADLRRLLDSVNWILEQQNGPDADTFDFAVKCPACAGK